MIRTYKKRVDRIESEMERRAGVVMAWLPSWIEAMREIEQTSQYELDGRFASVPPPPEETGGMAYVPAGSSPVEPGWHEIDALTRRTGVGCVLTWAHDKNEMGYHYEDGPFEPLTPPHSR